LCSYAHDMSPRFYEIQRSQKASCAPDRVRRLILDPSTWPRWQPEIVSIEPREPLAAGDVARGEADMLGFEVHGHTTVTNVDPISFEEDVVVGVRMKILYEVHSDGEGSLVTHKLVAQLPRGFVGRVLSLFLRRRLRALQKTALTNLVSQSEALSDS
jgi:hypothetical protein